MGDIHTYVVYVLFISSYSAAWMTTTKSQRYFWPKVLVLDWLTVTSGHPCTWLAPVQGKTLCCCSWRCVAVSYMTVRMEVYVSVMFNCSAYIRRPGLV